MDLATSSGFDAEQDGQLTWNDVFPWLASTELAFRSHTIPPLGTPGTNRLQRTGKVVRELRWNHEELHVFEAFPTLRRDHKIQNLELNNRLKHKFEAMDLVYTAELAEFKVKDFATWSNLGVKSTQLLLAVLTDQAIDDALSQPFDDVVDPQPVSVYEEHLDPYSETVEYYAEDPAGDEGEEGTALIIGKLLEELARYYSAIGLGDIALLSDEARKMGSERTREIIEDIFSVAATDILPGYDGEAELAQFFDELVLKRGAREQDILRSRILADSPETLEAVGKRYNVSRERIRQLEKIERESFYEEITANPVLASLMDAVNSKAADIRPIRDLFENYPALNIELPLLGVSLWRILERFSGGLGEAKYEIANGWLFPESEAVARQRAMESLEAQVNHHGVAPLSLVTLTRTDHLDQEATDQAFLNYLGVYFNDTHVFFNTRSRPEIAAAILFIEEKPMTAQELLDKLPNPTTLISFRNAIQMDDRIVRVGKSRYGLPEWGMEEYEGIATAMERYIAASGGTADFKEMAAELAEKFDVSERSILTYASTSNFRLKGGKITFDSTQKRRSTKLPEDTARCFRSDNGWMVRTEVNADHLRGSGFPLPTAIATIYDLYQGETIFLDADDDAQQLTWGWTGIHLGSIRRFLEKHDFAAGDIIFLNFTDDKRFELRHAAARTKRQDADLPLRESLRLAGHPAPESEPNPLQWLAAAINAPEGTTGYPLQSLFQKRGDMDIVTLLGAYWPTQR